MQLLSLEATLNGQAQPGSPVASEKWGVLLLALFYEDGLQQRPCIMMELASSNFTLIDFQYFACVIIGVECIHHVHIHAFLEKWYAI